MQVAFTVAMHEFEPALMTSGKNVLIRHRKKKDKIRDLKKADLQAAVSIIQVLFREWLSSLPTHDRARHRYGLGVC